MSLLSAIVLLILVMDPLGNIPLFLTALCGVDPARHRFIIKRELLIALGIMIIFLAAGRFLLDVLNVTPPALNAAGGVILLLIAFRMVFPTPERSLQEAVRDEPFVVPLAIPYTAGPSILATEVLLMSQQPERWPTWLAAVLIAWAISATILYFSSYLHRLLGDRGLTAIERLMGMILVIVAMEMLLDGIRDFFMQ